MTEIVESYFKCARTRISFVIRKFRSCGKIANVATRAPTYDARVKRDAKGRNCRVAIQSRW